MTNALNNRPRVYSKEEIKPGIYGWMDCPNWADFVKICEIKRIREEKSNGYIDSRYDSHLVAVYDRPWDYQIMEAYNKATGDGWRLWDRKPTKEQRRFWPWEGKPTKEIEHCFIDNDWTYYEAEDVKAAMVVETRKYYCDICGDEIEEYRGTLGLPVLYADDVAYEQGSTMDFCKDCMKSFDNWRQQRRKARISNNSLSESNTKGDI